MATIKEDYVSFETAVLLKEKGFNEPCYTCYLNKELSHYDYLSTNFELIDDVISAPTIQMAMKWLREVHHIFIQIELYSKYDDYNFEIFQNTYRLWIEERTVYSTYTETVEMAIKYTLEHLIK